MANHTHTSAQSIELGPPLIDSKAILHDTDTVEQQSGLISEEAEAVHGAAIGDARDVVKADGTEEERRLSRQPSRVSHSAVDTTLLEPAEKVQEKQVAVETRNSNALLNLPPPLPFDLRVSDLWVGVPHRGPST
jgi:hypothetical protein